jgi:tetratricopeptide (TPR) repeat protein
MRRGDIELAAERLDAARSQLTELDMSEWIDDLDTRRLELDLLIGHGELDVATALLDRFGDEHPFRVRVLRAIGLIRADAGDHASAGAAFDEALELAPDGFERALTLRAMALALPDPSADRSSEADEILTRLEVRCPPPLTAADLRRDLSVRT